MIAAASSLDSFGGLSTPYKHSFDLKPSQIKFKHAGGNAPPETRTLDAPPVRASVATDRKKANAQICYTRIVSTDSHRLAAGKAEDCLFVSRTQSMYNGSGTERRSLGLSLDGVNLRLASEAAAALPAAQHPLDGWRAVKELREWTLDGVLLGLENEANSSAALNVCVAGTCPARNVFDPDCVFATDVCFLALVAHTHDAGTPDQHYRFSYLPCTSRTLAEPDARYTSLLHRPPSISAKQRRATVGAWKVGRVLDSSAVRARGQQQLTLTLDVRVEWVDWRALLQHFPDSQIGKDLLALPNAPSNNPCELFYWPTAVSETGPLEAPSVAQMNADELRLNTDAVADELRRCPPAAPARTKRKRSSDEQLLDSPPTSPLQSDLLLKADEGARSLLNKYASDMDSIVKTLGNKDHVAPSDFAAWVGPLRRDTAVFALEHSEAFRKVREEGQSPQSEPIALVVELVDMLQTFLRKNRPPSPQQLLDA